MMTDHYVTREEWEMLMARKQRRGISCTGLFVVVATIAALLLILWSIVPQLLFDYGVSADQVRALFRMPTPATTITTNTNVSTTRHDAQTEGRPPMPPAAPFSVGGSLPDCATVADTTTACVRTVNLQPPTATEAPAPSAEPTPPYESACVSAPDGPPCWAPDAATLPLPETPIVLVPQWEGVPFTRDVCQDWHPPMPYPEECGE